MAAEDERPGDDGLQQDEVVLQEGPHHGHHKDHPYSDHEESPYVDDEDQDEEDEEVSERIQAAQVLYQVEPIVRDRFVKAGSVVWFRQDDAIYVADAYGGRLYRLDRPLDVNGLKKLDDFKDRWRSKVFSARCSSAGKQGGGGPSSEEEVR